MTNSYTVMTTMKYHVRKIITVCALYLFTVSFTAYGQDSLRNALRQLDVLIEKRAEIHAGHDFMLDSLRKEMQQATDPWKKYHLCGSLFYENLHYQADSSLYYIEKKRELIPLLGRPDLQNEIYINRAEALSVKGHYDSALRELKRIRPAELEEGMRQYYYSVFCSYYNWLADFTIDQELKETYMQEANSYRDSILQILPPGVNHDIVFSNLLLVSQAPDEVIEILSDQLKNATEPKEQTYVHCNLAKAYAAKQDTLRQMYHLTQAAIMDMRMSVREYTALQELAWLVYIQGDTERAYRYVDCSLLDATECNSQLRFVENGKVFPIVNKSLIEKTRREYRTSQRMLLATAILLLLLAVATACLIWWMKKLSDMRRQLQELNEQQAIANQSLQETGKIKEVYIAHYLDRCVDYLEKQEQYRRSLEKLAMASKTAELFKAIRSDSFLREERKNFYMEFDHSFLNLFPHFVDDLNRLLVKDGQLYPKQGELLSTELRIFALIRLGVTDANRIARFLGCSLTTVYNYRSKVRNRAINKEGFEEEVMKL